MNSLKKKRLDELLREIHQGQNTFQSS